MAAELGLTQSAISQSLRRLRDIFGDELFLRRPHGMEPTATALALEAPVAAAVDALRGALGAARAFDPATATGLVRIAALDAEQAVLIPRLAARLRRLAPGLTLSVLPLGRGAAMEALTEGRADLVLGYVWDRPESVSGAPLYEEFFLVAGRPDALPRAPHVSLDEYCAADHVVIAPGGDLHGVVDGQLEAMGRSRRVVLGLPAFLPALAAVAASGALVTLPARVAQSFAPGFGLVTARLQVEQMKVAYREAETRAKLAAETLAYQSGELARQRTLSDKGVAAVSAMDDARHLERLAEEENIAAQQGVDKALAALGGEPDAPVDSHPAVRSAMVALEEAKYNLGLTTVTAPADGIVYQAASFRPGQYVTSGTALFALVETGQVWVDANFKETQLTNIREGQEAEIVFDPLPGRTFRARVGAIGAGTGAEFSLLPAQNATGNWVKVTQRLPVRLALEDMPDLPILASGVSAEVRVDTGKGNSVRDLLTARAGTR
ncbi:MAG: LysR substrate-binding domain-containing protein [Pseudomonadota bacterium]